MALSKIQSLVAQLDAARCAYDATPSWPENPVADEAYRKVRNELMVACIRELSGHDGVCLAASPAKRFDSKPLTITVTEIGELPPTFGPKLAGMLNDCRKWYWPGKEEHLLREAKPSDHHCVRSEDMIMQLLSHRALDHSNVSPDEVLDPITPADMKVFGVPGGLLAQPWPGTPGK